MDTGKKKDRSEDLLILNCIIFFHFQYLHHINFYHIFIFYKCLSYHLLSYFQKNKIYYCMSFIISKIPYFFSLEKFAATHSLDFRYNCIFFFSENREKKYSCTFFFPERVYMPLTQLFWRCFNKKQGDMVYFFKKAIFNPVFCCIFFYTRSVFFFFVFFFPENSLNLTHSLVSNHVFFFPAPEKKIHHFYSLTRFWTKLSQK